MLVALEENEKRMYAIERVRARTYALCKLQDAVGEEDVLRRAKLVLTETYRPPKLQVLELAKDAPWWARAAVEVPRTAEKTANRPALPTLIMQRVMDAPAKIGERSLGLPIEKLSPMPPIGPESRMADPARPPPSPQDVLHDLTKHYIEALYIERTSLAYFTKGPLSRARAAFISQSPDATPADLVEFLRQSILTSTVLDKKYKETLPELVRELPASSLESPADVAKRKKNKKKWKARRSKAGFFVGEEDYVKRWWQADGETGATEDADTALRQRVSKLRMRETFLQLTLALEVLSLEASPGFAIEAGQVGSVGLESQAAESQQAESQIIPDAKPKRPKKKQDLPSLLESLLDKLCIWQSLESLSPAKSRISQDQGNGDSNDVLRNFCIEVVVPFFSSRIPQHALLVNKKLGGPSAQTPPKRRSTSIRRPGEPAIRQPPERKPRQPLARVSTDTLNRSVHKPPALLRSATESDALSHIKREPSETPSLTSVPLSNALERAKPQRRSRTNVLEQMSSKPRLIDLSAMSQASEAKLRRKAESDRAIKEAVEGIKKPNRALAVKDVADTTDQSFAKAMAKNTRPQQRGKKAEAERVEKTNAPPTKGDGLQKTDVAATPSGYRRRAPSATPYKRAMATNSGAPQEPASSHSSSASIVPSSSARLQVPRPTSITTSQAIATFAVPHTGHRARRLDVVSSSAIQETPSRGFAKFMPKSLATQPGTGMLDSPIARRTTAVTQATPSKGQAALKVPAAVAVSAPGKEVGIWLCDEMNDDGLEEAGISPDNSTVRSAANEETSVYTALGWEDDGYEELT